MNLLNFKIICQITGKNRSTIWRWIRSGNFPKPINIGPNSAAWTEQQIQDWVSHKMGGQL